MQAVDSYTPVRPVGSSHVILETVLLQLQGFLGRKSLRRHTDILDVTDLVTFGQTGIMHGPRIPEDQVTRVHINLDELAAAVLEPLEIPLVEKEQVHVLHLRWRSILVVVGVTVLSEEFIEEFGRAFHEHETAIFGTIGGKVN